MKPGSLQTKRGSFGHRETLAAALTGLNSEVLFFIIILKPCNLYLLYVYVPTKLHLNLLY